MRERLETQQIAVYIVAISLGIGVALVAPAAAEGLESGITPVIAALLYTTFLQVPLTELRGALGHWRFSAALVVGNFVAVPLLVWALFQIVPSNPAVQIGVLLVLLTPCIDYVVVFTHLGQGNSRLILAATPILLLLQILLLPLYLWSFLGAEIADLLRPGPFLEAFLWFIVVPLVLAWLTELWAKRHAAGTRFASTMAWSPVPLMALTLFMVAGAAFPKVQHALDDILGVLPVYVAYVVAAPLAGLAVARIFRLDCGAGRALIFSTSTRNSLVVLPLALAAPFGAEIVAAVVVTQTLVELLAELTYIRLVPRLMTPPPGLPNSPS